MPAMPVSPMRNTASTTRHAEHSDPDRGRSEEPPPGRPLLLVLPDRCDHTEPCRQYRACCRIFHSSSSRSVPPPCHRSRYSPQYMASPIVWLTTAGSGRKTASRISVPRWSTGSSAVLPLTSGRDYNHLPVIVEDDNVGAGPKSGTRHLQSVSGSNMDMPISRNAISAPPVRSTPWLESSLRQSLTAHCWLMASVAEPSGPSP